MKALRRHAPWSGNINEKRGTRLRPQVDPLYSRSFRGDEWADECSQVIAGVRQFNRRVAEMQRRWPYLSLDECKGRVHNLMEASFRKDAEVALPVIVQAYEEYDAITYRVPRKKLGDDFTPEGKAILDFLRGRR